jgi:hypothetical protein
MKDHGHPRPQYETNEDISNEERAIPSIESALRGEARKLPKNHFADFVVVDQKSQIIAFVEYKKRSFKWGDYPTVMLSAEKFGKLRAVADMRVRSFFVVEAKGEELKAVELTRPDLDFKIEYGGRTFKTRDSYDIEPVAHLSANQFRRI